MDEAPVVDCPPTPEILPLSSTPPSRLEVVCSSSSEDLEEATDGRRSPPPKCAICLGKCRQRAYTNSCRHQFCFRCLLEWSKVKPECPLCKQRFFSIVYFKSSNRYVEHRIGPQETEAPGLYHQLNLILADTPRYTYHSTVRFPSQNERLQQLLLHQSREVDRFIRTYGNEPIPSRQEVIEWRRFIYMHGLYACPLNDINGRSRECSAAFYRDNPAQLHRIIPWMNRELYAIGIIIAVPNNAPGNMATELLRLYNIDSPQFLQHIARHVPLDIAEHFQHELGNFARSPYDLIGYDRCVRYNPRFITRSPVSRAQVISSTEEEDNDDIVFQPAPASSSSTSAHVATATVAVASGPAPAPADTSGNSSTAPGASTSGNSSTAPGASTSGTANGSAVRRDLDTTVVSQQTPAVPPISLTSMGIVEQVPLSAPTPNVEDIWLSSSDSDECQFVMAQKPPHLRTPDHVVDLESASDSDVVFVSEASPAKIPSQGKPNILKNDSASCHGYNNGASTSSGYCGGGSGGSVASGTASTSRGKYYARPRPNRCTSGIGVKTLYEACDSDDTIELFNLTPVVGMSPELSSASSSHDEFVIGSMRRGRKRLRTIMKNAQPKRLKTVAQKNRRASSSSSSNSSRSSSSNSSNSSSSSSNSNSSKYSRSSHSSSESRSSSSSSHTSGCSNISSSSASSSSSNSATNQNGLQASVANETSSVRQSRRQRNRKLPAADSSQAKPAVVKRKESKSRTKKKQLKGGSKRTKAKKQSVQTVTVTTAAPSSRKSKQSQLKKRTEQHKKASKAVRRSKTATKTVGRNPSSLRSKHKQRLKAASGHETDGGSRSTPVVDEDARAAMEAHYIITTRPSSSPTVDVAQDGGSGVREPKLKSVIIKRCHYNKSAAMVSLVDAEGAQSTSMKTPTKSTPKEEEPSTSRVLILDGVERTGNAVVTVDSAEGDTIIDGVTDRTDEPAFNAMQLSSSASSGSGSDSPVSSAAWCDVEISSVLASATHILEDDPYHLMPTNPPHQQPSVEEFSVELLQPPTNANDQRQPSLIGGSDTLMEAEGSNSGASDPVFEPTLNWVESEPPPLIVEDRGFSPAAASPFSSISFPPSSTSVSSSPSLSSQSLALPTSASPLPLIEGIGTIDSNDSPLPSSVLGIETIDGTIDEIMATEVVHTSGSESASGTIATGALGEIGSTAERCELVPNGGPDGNIPATRVEL